MISTAVILNALELGCIYSLVALALFLSFRILNIADMTTNGAFTLGCAVSATVALAGHPYLAFPLAMLAGAAAGFITAMLQTKFRIPSILAGIITDTGLYTVNLAVMGFSSNVNLLKKPTLFTQLKPALGTYYRLVPSALIAAIAVVLMVLFLKTRLGLSIRATGDNPDMVRASSINTSFTITVGLCVSNACTALSGALLAQYNGANEINVGRGAIVIGLAAVIIGDVLLGKVFRNFALKLVSVSIGAIIYYIVMQAVLAMGLNPNYLKALSALVVAVFLSIPYWKGKYFHASVKTGGADVSAEAEATIGGDRNA